MLEKALHANKNLHNHTSSFNILLSNLSTLSQGFTDKFIICGFILCRATTNTNCNEGIIAFIMWENCIISIHWIEIISTKKPCVEKYNL